MTDYVIIVAGGKGLRMGSDIPKQFLPVGGRPVLMRTIERFREYSADLQIILVLPKAQQDYWRQLCQEYHFPLPQQEGDRGGAYQLADGGETRFHSVQHGLALATRRPAPRRPSSPLSPSSRPCATSPKAPSPEVTIAWCRLRRPLTSSC